MRTGVAPLVSILVFVSVLPVSFQVTLWSVGVALGTVTVAARSMSMPCTA